MDICQGPGGLADDRLHSFESLRRGQSPEALELGTQIVPFHELHRVPGTVVPETRLVYAEHIGVV